MRKDGTTKRVMMIGLDGCEPAVLERMMAAGRLPALSKLASKSARYLLDHGAARSTGLAWEHVSSGLDPREGARWSAVHFDPNTYGIRQHPTKLTPFAASLDKRMVVMDTPYFDLRKAPDVQGFVGWGAHDPGVPSFARPASLIEEVTARFGDYKAKKWTYGFVWQSPERAREMADAMVAATKQRAAMASWLFGERLPDWELGFFVMAEFHSAAEALWHGIDATHPLHGLPSAEAAREGIESIYVASDEMIANMVRQFPDTTFVVFFLHGMGPNNADVPSMALFPELLYRKQFGHPLMRSRVWPKTPEGVPLLDPTKDWAREVNRLCRPPIVNAMDKVQRRLFGDPKKDDADAEFALEWMPTMRYHKYWPQMRAFALPSYYDGRVRINLKGREANGIVEPGDFEAARDEVEALARECLDPATGRSAVESVERTPGNPLDLSDTDCDMVVSWSMSAPLALEHPRLGTIGPLPYRRTGGHTGPYGFAYFNGPGFAPGDHGVRSSFDIVPTVIDLLGENSPNRLSGRSLVPEMV